MELNMWRRCHLQWYGLLEDFNEIYHLVRKLLVGDIQTDGGTDRLTVSLVIP
jgi:hypothetical protein